MRFRSAVRSKPKHGDTRTVIRFALFPTRVEGDIIVWLELYEEHQEYHHIVYDGFEETLTHSGWDTVRKTAK